jgi:decaprenylphospho-beta-D-erythro-pentofuranosid-2-ulose 2-reductase
VASARSDRDHEVRRFDAEKARFIDDVFTRVGDIGSHHCSVRCAGDQEAAERDPTPRRHRVNYLGPVSVGVTIARAGAGARHHHRLSSVAGERARRANFVYGSSKAGMDTFFQGLGDSLVGSGVKVMIVRPGFVHTKMTAGMEEALLATDPKTVAEAIVDGLT